jgi:hypothetical protein
MQSNPTTRHPGQDAGRDRARSSARKSNPDREARCKQRGR